MLWGAAGTAANWFAGHMIDTIGNRKLIVSMLAVLIVVKAVLHSLATSSGLPAWRSRSGAVAVGASWCRSSIGL